MSYGQRRISPAQAAGIFIGAICLALIVYFWTRPGVFSKVSIIVHHNWLFWTMMVGGMIYAFYRRWRNPGQFVWGEVPVQIGASALILYLISHFFFFQGSDVKDVEVWNGYVTRALYAEPYETEHCSESCDSDGNNCTETCSCIDHGPSWHLETNNSLTVGPENVGINAAVYKRYKEHFGNEKVVGHNGDIACDTGNVYATTFNGNSALIVPTAIEHDFVNYLKASDSIRKTTGGNTTGYEAYLKPYPRVHNGHFGTIYLDRVINAGVNIPSGKGQDYKEWATAVDGKLDLALTQLGRQKEVNILVYLVGSGDRGFLQALEEHWIKGKKNDVIVIIGTSNFPEVQWVEVIAWTESEEFKVALKNRVQKLGTINNGGEFADNIIAQVSLPAERGGFMRMPMSELAYLAADVEIAWWAMFLILIIYIFLSWLCSWALENNEVKDFAARAHNATFGRINRNWRNF